MDEQEQEQEQELNKPVKPKVSKKKVNQTQLATPIQTTHIMVEVGKYTDLVNFYNNFKNNEKSLIYLKVGLEKDGNIKVEISWDVKSEPQIGYSFGEILFHLCNNHLKANILQQIVNIVQQDKSQENFVQAIFDGWQEMEVDQVCDPVLNPADTFKMLIGNKS